MGVGDGGGAGGCTGGTGFWVRLGTLELVRSGEWSELAGMLALANGSGRIGALEESVGGVMGRTAESATLYVRRKVGRAGIEITEVGDGRPVGKDEKILCEFQL